MTTHAQHGPAMSGIPIRLKFPPIPDSVDLLQCRVCDHLVRIGRPDLVGDGCVVAAELGTPNPPSGTPVSAAAAEHSPTVSHPSGLTRWHVVRVFGDEDTVRRDLAEARELAVGLARGAGAPSEHLDDVAEVGNELIINAIQATTTAPRPPQGVLPTIFLGICATARYTHIQVRDAVPTEPNPRPRADVDADIGADDVSDVHGFGLGFIVEALCAAWWTVMRAHDKTVHAIVPRPGVGLSPAELEALQR